MERPVLWKRSCLPRARRRRVFLSALIRETPLGHPVPQAGRTPPSRIRSPPPPPDPAPRLIPFCNGIRQFVVDGGGCHTACRKTGNPPLRKLDAPKKMNPPLRLQGEIRAHRTLQGTGDHGGTSTGPEKHIGTVHGRTVASWYLPDGPPTSPPELVKLGLRPRLARHSPAGLTAPSSRRTRARSSGSRDARQKGRSTSGSRFEASAGKRDARRVTRGEHRQTRRPGFCPGPTGPQKTTRPG